MALPSPPLVNYCTLPFEHNRLNTQPFDNFGNIYGAGRDFFTVLLFFLNVLAHQNNRSSTEISGAAPNTTEETSSGLHQDVCVKVQAEYGVRVSSRV